MSLFMGLVFTACNDDDDYFINTDPILNESSVVTGSADVTATSATLFGTISGLENSAAASYTVGFNYGTDANALTQSVQGTLTDGNVTATITGLTEGTTIFYQAFARLQGKVTFTGEVKSLVTTDAVVTTKAASSVGNVSAVLGGSVTGMTTDATVGIVISTKSDVEAVRAGLILPAATVAPDFTVDVQGLLPSKTYYYAAYVNLGTGIVYGSVESFTTAAQTFDLDNDLVDLGLSVKWAKYNVGATVENELGGRFGFGDVNGVNNSIDPSDFASADTYKTANDIVNQTYGGKATLPTAADFEELFSLCKSEWTTQDGVAGYKLTGPNGNSIFLPAAGSRTINDVTGLGTEGVYLTGSINPNNNQYAIAYEFNASTGARTSIPVYEAVSARAVSTARNVLLDKSKLYNTWEIDFNNGSSAIFAGPVHFYGTDDSWRTLTNGEPVVGDSWAWEADATNTWAFGDCTGYMTINEDGTIVVKNQNGEEKTGKYTIDTNDMTITADIDLLVPDNFIDGFVNNRKNKIKILTQSDNTLQFGYYRDADPATLSVNYIPQSKKYGFAVNLFCVGADWAGTWGETVATIMPLDLEGVHTFTYNGSCNGAMVFTLDLVGLHEKNPDAIVAIKEIRCDGKPIEFDGNKMFYGDIEGNGNYRIEFFNIWGKGSVDGNVASPFSNVTGGSDPNFNFAEKLEMDFVILTNPTFTPNLITINPSWGGTWGFNQGASFNIVVNEDFKLDFSQKDFDITYTSADHADGSIMTFIEVKDLFNYFPGTHSELTGLVLDGTAVTGWDPAKVVDTNDDGGAYRLELWNCYGATGGNNADNCAFGPRNGDVVKALAFTQSMQTKFTFKSLFKTPAF